MIGQSGELYFDASQIPPGVEVEFVEVKEEQSGMWDFLNHVMSGDEELPESSSDSGAPNHIIPSTSPEAHAAVTNVSDLEFSPRRRNSVGGSNKGPDPPAVSDECSTPVQEEVPGGSRTPLLSSLNSTINEDHCILCGKRSQTVHNSRSRSRSV